MRSRQRVLKFKADEKVQARLDRKARERARTIAHRQQRWAKQEGSSKR